MGYYNYHAMAKRLIAEGHCKAAVLKEKHNNISPALLLIFDNHFPMPIRLERFEEYFKMLKDFKIKVNRE